VGRSQTETTAERFERYHTTPASRLRYDQAQHNLQELHELGSSPLAILDAAGGNGLNTEYFLERGHRVTLLDSDPEMLEQAKARLGDLGLMERCSLVEGTLEQVDELVPRGRFDLILCHHVIEYTSETPRIFQGFERVASASGQVSLITLNPVSEVIRGIVFRRDPELARTKLTDLSYDAKWFGQARLYPFEQIVDWARDAGWELGGFRAIRVLADYLAEEVAKSSYDDLLRLENELSALEPYRRFGRYLQFAFARGAH
jgi:ubiquinone/menaquinone biosynthesis C-methylase UbiE